jgi:predicted permease
LISWGSGAAISKALGFKKRTQNFVIAMAVFGNSNSLPISLVTSLAFTIKGLHWDKEPNDNDSSVATRGITYLVIFQQLGQIIRWSWGYKILLRPADEYNDHELEEHECKARFDARVENGEYHDDASIDSSAEDPDEPLIRVRSNISNSSPSDYGSGAATPMHRKRYASSGSTCSCESDECENSTHHASHSFPTPTNGIASYGSEFSGHAVTNGHHIKPYQDSPLPPGPKGWWLGFTRWFERAQQRTVTYITSSSRKAFSSLPRFVQKFFIAIFDFIMKLLSPPLAAMIFAIPIVIFPSIKHFFYGTEFMKGSFIPAVRQTGDVAVPLIIVCLGAGLARNTLPEDQKTSQDPTFDRKVLIAALTARMVLPLVIMAPLLALTARYLPVNILGDPIFIIVCFLLAGAPTALQLSQICQINNVYMGAMTRLLTQSYVVWYVSPLHHFLNDCSLTVS